MFPGTESGSGHVAIRCLGCLRLAGGRTPRGSHLYNPPKTSEIERVHHELRFDLKKHEVGQSKNQTLQCLLKHHEPPFVLLIFHGLCWILLSCQEMPRPRLQCCWTREVKGRAPGSNDQRQGIAAGARYYLDSALMFAGALRLDKKIKAQLDTCGPADAWGLEPFGY